MADDDKIVSLSAERERRDGPDPEHACFGPDGVKWFEFGVDFDDGDSTFSFTIWAKDWEDAERRVELIRTNARVVGQLYMRIPE
jgi:hypothetical protein